MFERELAKLLEGTTDAAFTVDLQGEVRTWNKAAEALFGYPASLTVGKACAAFVGGRSDATPVCCQGCDVLECARVGRDVANFDMEIRTRSGERVWVNVSLLVVANELTRLRLVVHFMRDIRERKQAERLTGEVMQAARRLVNSSNEPGGLLPPVAPLSEREKEVLSLLAAGKSTGEVAGELRISAGTLRNHVSNINQKLRTRSRVEAVMQARKRGLI